MINVKIDGVIVTPQLPFEYTVDGTEEYNKGEFELKGLTRKEAFPDYALIEIGNKRFILESDTPIRVSKNNYTHKITITEEIKLLKKIIIPDRKFTTYNGTQVTWSYIVSKLITDINNQQLYTVDTATSLLLNKKSDFTELVGGTLLDHLTRIFRAINAVPVLTGTVISHELIGNRKNPIQEALQDLIDDDEVIARQTFSNIEDYASDVYTKSKNATYERDDDVVSVFPYVGGYVTPRSSSNKYNDTDSRIEFDSNIREIKKAYHVVTLEYPTNLKGFFGSNGDLPLNPINGDYYECNLDNYTSAVSGDTYNIGDTAIWVYDSWLKNSITAPKEIDKAIDVTEYVYLKNDWDKLEIETNYNTILATKCQNNTLYVQNNFVLNLGVEYSNTLITDSTTYEMMINSINAKTEFDALAIKDVDIIDTKWQFEYTAKRDVDFIQERTKSDKVTKKITIINQQNDSEVELSRLGKSSFSKVNRIGNDKYQITVKAYNLDDLEDIGNYDSNNYAISGYKVLVRANTIYISYEFVKNLAPLQINETVQNNREKFTITNRQVQTNFIKKYNIVVSETQESDLTNLPLSFRSRLLNGYDYLAIYDRPVTSAVFEYSGAGAQYIGMSVKRAVVGNTMLFHTQFQSPTVAGAQLVATGLLALAHKRVNVNYTNVNGEVTTYKIHYGDTLVSTPSTFPVVTSFVTFFGDVTRYAYLNPDEVLAETMEFDVLTDSEDLLIYDSFAQDNSLIKKLNGALNLTAYIYTDDTALKYTKDTQEVISGYTSTCNIVVTKSASKIFINTIQALFAFAIADSDGNLHLVRKTKNTNKEIYFNYKEVI